MLCSVCKHREALHCNDIWYYLDTSDDEAITSELREEPSGVDLGGYARYRSQRDACWFCEARLRETLRRAK